ncbi:hypothetical protein [Desulfogranum marinum]|uniref:hypothetical protein n=1 Tax=Desulfogranum marinum TaxID=453220 RepID=UPI001966A9A1|nr:hypothetical protein [Desulfogranum marinum]MBM9513664.1 hypothetical protein [Desulfogranum marinum]
MQDELKEMRENIKEVMEYAVPDGFFDKAEDLLDVYRDDRIGLNVLLEFYRTLPGAKEALIKDIVLFARQHGVFLLGAMTGLREGYLYLVSSEGIEFQGTVGDGFLARELLDFFQYESEEEFKRICAEHKRFVSYDPLQIDEDICPACHACTGEEHELGCPVEICPWCGGQLVYCSCRFEQLGLDAISTEQDLLQLEALLEERGRIPYSPEQRPNYADEGPGVIIE